MKTWHLATCEDCTPRLAQPFSERDARDAWAKEHETTGHVVTLSTEVEVSFLASPNEGSSGR